MVTASGRRNHRIRLGFRAPRFASRRTHDYRFDLLRNGLRRSCLESKPHACTAVGDVTQYCVTVLSPSLVGNARPARYRSVLFAFRAPRRERTPAGGESPRRDPKRFYFLFFAESSFADAPGCRATEGVAVVACSKHINKYRYPTARYAYTKRVSERPSARPPAVVAASDQRDFDAHACSRDCRDVSFCVFIAFDAASIV